MSSFSKKGYKDSQKKFVKFHSKGVNIILEQLDKIYYKIMEGRKIHLEMNPGTELQDLTEDTVVRIATDIMGRDLDSMELNILKGKFGLDEQEDHAE